MIKKHFLTLLFAAAVLAYHATNILGSAHSFIPSVKWQPTRIDLKLFGQSLASFPSIAVDEKRFKQIDSASELVSGTGYVLRFASGQLPDWILESSKAGPYRHFYLREEVPFQYESALPAVTDGFDRQIQKFGDDLSRQGVTVLVLPIPTKISLERGYLPTELPPGDVWNSLPEAHEIPDATVADAVFEHVINANPKYTVDVLRPFRDFERARPSELIFVPGDQHWASQGISLAVTSILEKLRGDGWKLGDPEIHLASHSGPAYGVDLIRATLLPQYYLRRSQGLAWDEPYYDVTETSSAAPNARVVIVGSSFAERLSHTPYGLGPLLAKALHRELIDDAVNGGSTTGALKKLIQSGVHLRPGDLLIWEFPIRMPFHPDEFAPEPVVDGEPTVDRST